MGNFVHFPICKPPIGYHLKEHFTPLGEKRADAPQYGVGRVTRNAFEEITETFFDQMVQEREQMMIARNKFNAIDIDYVSELFPDWTTNDILDLKAQFQTFDINRDGLIDFEELCCVLDELGKDMDLEAAEEMFREIDKDGSGAVDFEEFLELIKSVYDGGLVSKAAKDTYLGVIGQSETKNVKRLSIAQQINHGLF